MLVLVRCAAGSSRSLIGHWAKMLGLNHAERDGYVWSLIWRTWYVGKSPYPFAIGVTPT